MFYTILGKFMYFANCMQIDFSSFIRFKVKLKMHSYYKKAPIFRKKGCLESLLLIQICMKKGTPVSMSLNTQHLK